MILLSRKPLIIIDIASNVDSTVGNFCIYSLCRGTRTIQICNEIRLYFFLQDEKRHSYLQSCLLLLQQLQNGTLLLSPIPSTSTLEAPFTKPVISTNSVITGTSLSASIIPCILSIQVGYSHYPDIGGVLLFHNSRSISEISGGL